MIALQMVESFSKSHKPVCNTQGDGDSAVPMVAGDIPVGGLPDNSLRGVVCRVNLYYISSDA
jgi:hypothetical protein